MKINFDLLGVDNSADTVINPREIFSLLPKKDPIYNYPRDVQTEVWNKWFDSRDNEYNVIKMWTFPNLLDTKLRPICYECCFSYSTGLI